MDYRRYIADENANSDDVLRDWHWLTGPELKLWLVTKAGDAFLRHSGDNSIHFLDVVSAELNRVASDEDEFKSVISISENATKWLMPDVVDSQAMLGMVPAANECLSFKIPPILGGQLEPDNFETCDITVHFSIAGQLHKQVKDLPPGTKITDIKIDGPPLPEAERRPWWRFW